MVYQVLLSDDSEINVVAANDQEAATAAKSAFGLDPIHIMVDSWSFFMDGTDREICDRLNAERMAKSVTSAEHDYMDACVAAIDGPTGRRF